MKKFQTNTLIYFIPIAAFMAADNIFGRTYYNTAGDQIISFYAMGLDIIANAFQAYHHPDFTFLQIAALIDLSNLKAGAGDVGTAYESLFVWGQVVNLLFGLLAAVWMAALAKPANLKWWQVALLSLMAISMPAATELASDIGGYFPAIVLSVPLGVGCYLLMVCKRPPKWVATSVFAAIGFLLSNLFLSAYVVLGIGGGLLTILWQRDGTNGLATKLGVTDPPSRWPRLLLFVLLALFFYNVIQAVQAAQIAFTTYGTRRIAAIATVAAFITVLPKIPGWWTLLRGAVLPTLLSWLLFCNVFVLKWGVSAGRAFLYQQRFGHSGQLSDLPTVLGLRHWYWLIVIAMGLSVTMCLWLSVRRQWRQGIMAPLVVMAVISLFSNVGATYSTAFAWTGFSPYSFGTDSRFFEMLVAPIALLAVAAFKWSRLSGTATAIILVGISAWGLSDYLGFARTALSASNAAASKIEQLANDHVASSPDARVWCVNVAFPLECARTMIYTDYRTPEGLAKIPAIASQEGPFKFTPDIKEACSREGVCSVPGRDLFITGDVPPNQLPAGSEILHQDAFFGMVWRWQKP